MGRKPSEAQDKFIIRLPDGMRDQLKIASEANNRTMNAEVVARLKATFEADQLAKHPEIETGAKMDALEKELEIVRGNLRILESRQSLFEATVKASLNKLDISWT